MTRSRIGDRHGRRRSVDLRVALGTFDLALVARASARRSPSVPPPRPAEAGALAAALDGAAATADLEVAGAARNARRRTRAAPERSTGGMSLRLRAPCTAEPPPSAASICICIASACAASAAACLSADASAAALLWPPPLHRHRAAASTAWRAFAVVPSACRRVRWGSPPASRWTGGGGMFFIMSTRPATLKSSPTTGSIQSEYIAPTMPKCSKKLNAAMIVSDQSICAREAALHRERELRARLHGRRSDELEEERGLADDDLAARFLGELHLVGVADLLRLTAERARGR